MKKLIIISLILINYSYSQSSGQKISFLTNFGISNVLINSDFKDNYTNSFYSIDINYKFYKGIYVGSGFKYNESINIQNIEFNSFEIPLYLGSNISIGESISKGISLNAEIGGYLRNTIVSDKSFTGNNTFGFSSKIGVHLDLTNFTYTRFSYLRQFESGKLFNNENLRFENISSFMFTIGFRL